MRNPRLLETILGQLLALILLMALSILVPSGAITEPGANEGGAPAARAETNEKAPREAESPPGAELKAGPKSSKERTAILDDLYARLGAAADAREAAPLAAAIERIWLYSGSDTIAVLMERSLDALSGGNPDLALKLLDAVVELAPDFAEGWNRRAVVHYRQKDYTRALGDLRRVLALEPNHFKALEGLGQIMMDVGQKRGALEAYRQLKKVHPHWSGADQMLKELEREVEGIGI